VRPGVIAKGKARLGSIKSEENCPRPIFMNTIDVQKMGGDRSRLPIKTWQLDETYGKNGGS